MARTDLCIFLAVAIAKCGDLQKKKENKLVVAAAFPLRKKVCEQFLVKVGVVFSNFIYKFFFLLG